MSSEQTTTELNVVSVDTESGRVTLRRGVPLIKQIEARLAEDRIAQEFLEAHGETVRFVERKGWTVEEVLGVGENYLSVEASTVVHGHRVDYNLRVGAPTERWVHNVGDGQCGIYRSTPSGHVMSPELALRLSEEHEARVRARVRLEADVYRYLLSQCEFDEEPSSDEVKCLSEECWSKGIRPGELDHRVVRDDPFWDDDDKVFRIELES